MTRLPAPLTALDGEVGTEEKVGDGQEERLSQGASAIGVVIIVVVVVLATPQETGSQGKGDAGIGQLQCVTCDWKSSFIQRGFQIFGGCGRATMEPVFGLQ